MIQSIGVDHRLPIEIREQFSVINKRIEANLDELSKVSYETVLLSTCNRTEIYFISDSLGDEVIDEIFDTMGWNKSLKKYTFYKNEEETVEHLMLLVCGFDSLIRGEDQILSQVKQAYELSLKNKTLGSEFSRLFKKVIRCGKEFRQATQLHRIPISYSSISVNESIRRGFTKFMVVGYGEVGKLTLKYILSNKFEKVYVVVRDENEADFFDPKVEFISFKEREYYYDQVESIITATSAPHTVIEKSENLKNKVIFDLAVPRDVAQEVYSDETIEIYNVDKLDDMDHENQLKRKEIMEKNRYIIDKYIKEFTDWKSTKEIIPYILKMKDKKEEIVDKRHKAFVNKIKTKDNIEFSRVLMDSTANAYLNRAIEVLKEEYLKGNGEECLKIIKKIFL